MSDHNDKDWMHYSGAKEGWEKMMNGAPSLSDYGRRRGVDPEDIAGTEGFAKAQAMHAAKIPSGAWMADTVNLTDFDLKGKKGGEPIYKHPLLAKMANKGYTFDEIQSAGNKLGIKSFNSENDAKAISEFLDKREGSYAEGLVEGLKKDDKEKEPEKEFTGDKEYTYSDKVQAAKDRLDSGMYDTASKLFNFASGGKDSSRTFNYGASREAPSTPFKQSNEPAPTNNVQADATGSYLNGYKRDLAKAGKLSENYANNMYNAMEEMKKKYQY